MTYPAYLPRVFPFAADVPSHQAARLARKLVYPGRILDKTTGEFVTVPGGSSFACTSEPGSGNTRVYLSDVSYRRLQEGGDLYKALPGINVALGLEE